MQLKEDIKKDIKDIILTKWSQREGQVVPESESIKLLNDGVNLKATMLYSDLAHSTIITTRYINTFAAEIYKLFLSTSSRIIKYWNGYIRSFDGDRVMAVFIGDNKSDNAIAAALQISYCVQDMIVPKLRNDYTKLDDSFKLEHCTGIDTSEVFVIRGGVRNDNDLVWIGRAANAAAKLSDIRNGSSTVISDSTWEDMEVDSAFLDDINNNRQRTPIWEEIDWNEVTGISKIYQTRWQRIIN